MTETTRQETSNGNHERWLAETWQMIEECAKQIDQRHRISLSPMGCAALLKERSSHETKACVWEDCDQEAIYCAGHAREFVRGEPVKAADPKMVPCVACGNKPIDAQHCDVCYPPGACEWCATGIPRSTDGRRHESDMGVWACRAPAKKAGEQSHEHTHLKCPSCKPSTVP